VVIVIDFIVAKSFFKDLGLGKLGFAAIPRYTKVILLRAELSIVFHKYYELCRIVRSKGMKKVYSRVTRARGYLMQ
jgi:hypothetical protein